jgi:hypothetical protein
MIQIIQLDCKRRELDIYVPFVDVTEASFFASTSSIATQHDSEYRRNTARQLCRRRRLLTRLSVRGPFLALPTEACAAMRLMEVLCVSWVPSRLENQSGRNRGTPPPRLSQDVGDHAEAARAVPLETPRLPRLSASITQSSQSNPRHEWPAFHSSLSSCPCPLEANPVKPSGYNFPCTRALFRRMNPFFRLFWLE